jgi:predicted DCC family thiol-disulfide oxidoreductase YuxK
MSAALLYDRDCGFCRACLGVLLAWDRDRRVRPVAIQSVEGERLLADLEPARRLDSWHLVSEAPRTSEASRASGAPSVGEAQRSSAGAAFAPLLRELPGGAPLAALADRFPGAAERGYRWVAGHRGAVGRAVPSGVKRWADRRIDERGQGAAAGGR